MTQLSILLQATVVKLKEYRSSYGSPESIVYPFVKEFNNEIHLLNSSGKHLRTLRKGTKLLCGYSGKLITERAFKVRINKAIALNKLKALKSKSHMYTSILRMSEFSTRQAALWTKFLIENPEKVIKYKEKIASMPSSKGRNLLRLKAAKYVNGGEFNGLEISAPKLLNILNSL